MKRLPLLLLLIALALPGCRGRRSAPPESVPEPVLTYPFKELEEMTLREKVGQLFNVRIESLSRYAVTEADSLMDSTFVHYPCGAITFFGKNVETPEQVLALTEYLHGLGDNPPLLCIDEEGGLVSRVAHDPDFDVPRYPSVASIGASGNPRDALEAGRTIGTYLRGFGFDVNFAPLADINPEKGKAVMGSRSFGTDPKVVGKMVSAFLKGLDEAGVVGCMKHYPGHGEASKDTHRGRASIDKTWEELLAYELVPFISGIQAGGRMIMTGHLSFPKITGNAIPTTLSPVMLTEKLRGELGFDGVIVTDGLEMASIRGKYPPAKAAVKAVQAGADMLLAPFAYEVAFDAVVAAVEDGTISEARIDESVRRILALKKYIYDQKR